MVILRVIPDLSSWLLAAPKGLDYHKHHGVYVKLAADLQDREPVTHLLRDPTVIWLLSTLRKIEPTIVIIAIKSPQLETFCLVECQLWKGGL